MKNTKISMKDVVAKPDTVTVSFECSKVAAEELMPLLEYIGKNGNGGHSFGIVVDPDDSENRESFGFDGDGGSYLDIDSIKMDNIKRRKNE
jgi:hypothetical protein